MSEEFNNNGNQENGQNPTGNTNQMEYMNPNAGVTEAKEPEAVVEQQADPNFSQGYSNPVDTTNGQFGGYSSGEMNQSVDHTTNENTNSQGYWDNQAPVNNQSQTNETYNQYNQSQPYNTSSNPNNYSYNSTPVNNGENYDTEPMAMTDWLLTLLAFMIPCCGGIILYFVWAFSKKGNLNRRNFCRAALIIWGALMVIYFIFALVFSSSLTSIFNQYYYY